MNEWQPIETAPKDGTEILIYGEVVFGCLREDYYIGYAVGKYSLPHFDGDEEGWTSLPHGYGVPNLYPTGWAPLPKPPETP